MTTRTTTSPEGRTAGPAVRLGVDIGGTKTAVALFDERDAALARARAATPAAEGAAAVVAGVLELAARVLAEPAAAGTRLSGIGVGTAGVVAPDGRTVAAATEALPGWAGTPLAALLEDALGAPTTVLGDVQAFLSGELAAGAALGARSAVAVMAGTGIGGAIAVEGAVVRGGHGAAGHIGHVPVAAAEGHRCPCGAWGHVEAVASGPAMTALLRRERAHAAARDLRAVSAAAADGDAAARTVLRLGGGALGAALAGVVSTLDPDVVVLSGGVLEAGPWYEDALRAELASRALPLLRGTRVVRAALGADAVLLGAVSRAAVE
ncbi:ROK family protein [Streptomyces parvus]|uniref:ROK family protein n=1 Tax=Streptomyces parvus TaxID=66428 RepID=A0A5D4IGB6_9ACTN|nr:ROK family protein [Streptomyces parvus]TYR51732.1 ROK family protein [Streptomyces parvus]